MSTTPTTSPQATIHEPLRAALPAGSRPPRASALSASLTFAWRALLKIWHLTSQTTGHLDLTLMMAFHDAFRRDLAHLARTASRRPAELDEPARHTAVLAGWELFKTQLHVHHTAEDADLWPRMRTHLADRPDELALLQAMQDEHARIDPLLEAVDAAAADPDYGYQRFGDIADELAARSPTGWNWSRSSGPWAAASTSATSTGSASSSPRRHRHHRGNGQRPRRPGRTGPAPPLPRPQHPAHHHLPRHRPGRQPGHRQRQPAGQLRPHRPRRPGAAAGGRGLPVHLPANAARVAHHQPRQYAHLVAGTSRPGNSCGYRSVTRRQPAASLLPIGRPITSKE